MWRRRPKFHRCKGYSYHVNQAKKTPFLTVIRSKLLVITEIAAIIAIVAFLLELQNSTTTRINAAWELVISKAPGNSGKREALEYLNNWQCFYLDTFDWFGTSRQYEYRPIVRWVKNSLCFKSAIPLANIDLSPHQEMSQNPTTIKKEETNINNPAKGTYLRHVQLPNAYLSQANLSQAKLEGANFSRAYLYEANLSKASLNEADLTGANLIKADLRGAYLIDTDFLGANLYHADLRTAIFSLLPNSDTKDVCKLLKQAKSWQLAFRDKRYACGKSIPVHPDEVDNADGE